MKTNIDTSANILLVDDKYENLLVLESLLESSIINIFKATSGNQALGLMLEHDFAVILLDVQMPEMDGFEVAELMRKNEKTRCIPIIFVTAINTDDEYIYKGYEIGAVDYLFKPLNPIVLISKINIFLELYRNKKELEKSKQKIEMQNERLKQVSIRDGLTKLFNHKHLHEILQREFALAIRSRSSLSCFMIDLDYFKDVNDTFGHSFGDFVLQEFASRLIDLTRQTDIVARYGGEEFVVLLPQTDLNGAQVLAEKIRSKSEIYEYHTEEHSKRVPISIGISSFPVHPLNNAPDLIELADRALYRAKTGGRNQVRIYNEEALQKTFLDHTIPVDTPILRDQLPRILDRTREFLLSALEEIGLSKYNKCPFSKQRINLLETMGEHLGFPRPLLRTFTRAARIHDLVQLFHGDDSTEKNRPLTENEQEQIHDFPLIMEELTHIFDIFANERLILRHHHENYDGTGYPEGLRGPEVPIGARLFALIDAFVAMTSPRGYRPLLSPDQIINELIKGAGGQFDPMLVNHLLEIILEKKILPIPDHIIQKAKEDIKSWMIPK